MDYKKFYLAIRRYVKGRITRGEFMTDWGYAQRCQGIEIEKPKCGGLQRAVTA